MKILLTGGEGFVGKHFQRVFFEHAIQYVVYDLENGDDIRDRLKLDKLFEVEHFDTVINLAALAGVRRGNEYPKEYFDTNVFGVKNLIEIAEKYHVDKFIHYSSSSVFGHQDIEIGTVESDDKSPRSIYGMTKLVGELLLENSSLNYTIIRPFTIVGSEGRRDMVIFKWLDQIKADEFCTFYGDGSSFRGYTFIDDMIRGTIECLTNPNAKREDFNLGGDQKISLMELWDIFLSVYPNARRVEMDMPKSDQPYSFADTTKAFALLGWKHKTDIEAVIKRMIQPNNPPHHHTVNVRKII